MTNRARLRGACLTARIAKRGAVQHWQAFENGDCLAGGGADWLEYQYFSRRRNSAADS